MFHNELPLDARQEEEQLMDRIIRAFLSYSDHSAFLLRKKKADMDALSPKHLEIARPLLLPKIASVATGIAANTRFIHQLIGPVRDYMLPQGT
jgi:hypothetical protein